MSLARGLVWVALSACVSAKTSPLAIQDRQHTLHARLDGNAMQAWSTAPSGRSGALSLRLMRVCRDRCDELAAPTARIAEDGALNLERPGLVESWTRAASGLEHTLVLTKPVSGSGALSLELAATGMRYEKSDARGLHFIDEAA